MPDLPTRAELFDTGAREVLSRSLERSAGRRLSAEEIYTPGSDINLLIAASSAMAEAVLREHCLRMAALYIATAEGEDLDRLVADRFAPEIVRRGAQPAIVTLSFTRSSGPLAAVSLPVGAVLRTSDGIRFELTGAMAMPAGSTGPVLVLAEAIEAGTQGNAAAGAITQFLTSSPDPELRVTNPEPAAGGADQETDASLRARARDFFRAARRGTCPAIEFGALTVGGVRQATCVEEVDGFGDPSGRVQLFIADEQGQGNSALVTAVDTALLEYRAAGIVVDVFGAIPVFVEIRYRLRFEAGIDTLLAFEAVRGATVSRVNTLKPNETLTVSLLMEVARSVPGVIVLDDSVIAPVGDVVPDPGEVLRTTTSRVTVE